MSSTDRQARSTTAAATTLRRLRALLLLLLLLVGLASAFQRPAPVCTQPTTTTTTMAAATGNSNNEKRVERTYTKLLPPHVTSAAEAYDAWLQYAWIGGADLPLAKAPIIVERGDLQSGNGLLRRIPPIGIEEKIVAAIYPNSVEYKVINPGWTTYQVHDHKGEVRFEEVSGEGGSGKRVKVSWLLSVRPWFGFGPWVKLMGYIVINTMLKNLANHLEKKHKAAAQNQTKA